MQYWFRFSCYFAVSEAKRRDDDPTERVHLPLTEWRCVLVRLYREEEEQSAAAPHQPRSAPMPLEIDLACLFSVRPGIEVVLFSPHPPSSSISPHHSSSSSSSGCLVGDDAVTEAPPWAVNIHTTFVFTALLLRHNYYLLYLHSQLYTTWSLQICWHFLAFFLLSLHADFAD